MLSRRVRRQLFQVKNGGIPAVVKKVSKLRAFLTRVDSALFGRARLQRKICNVAPALKAIVANQVGATSAEIVANQEAAVIATQARMLRDSLKMTEAVKLIDDTEKRYPKSVELMKTKAQIHFRMGDWSKFVETSVRASAVCDQIAVHQQLNSINVRFLGSDWTGPLGHVVQLSAMIKLEKLNLLSLEKRVLLYDPKFVANLSLLDLFGKDLTMVKASRTEIDKFASKFEAIVDDVPTFRMKTGAIDQWSATDIANFEWKRSGNPTLLKLDDETAAKRQANGWRVVEDAGRGKRCVVASPRPMRIVELNAVRTLVGAGFQVVNPDPLAAAQQTEFAEAVHHLEGGLVRRADERDLGPHDIANGAGEERVVGAPQEQRVDVGVADRGE